jgi:hypothetical protein
MIERAGVIRPSAKSKAAANKAIQVMTDNIHVCDTRPEDFSTWKIAKIPPSPSLSARVMKSMYLILITMISDQKIRETMLRTFAPVTAKLVALKHTASAYIGLVPISPNTTPSAPRDKINA